MTAVRYAQLTHHQSFGTMSQKKKKNSDSFMSLKTLGTSSDVFFFQLEQYHLSRPYWQGTVKLSPLSSLFRTRYLRSGKKAIRQLDNRVSIKIIV